MSETTRGARTPGDRRRVTDEDLDRAIASLVDGTVSPELRSNVMRRIEAPAGHRRLVPGWQVALAGVTVVVLAVSLWLTRGPASAPAPTAPVAAGAVHHAGDARRSDEPDRGRPIAGVQVAPATSRADVAARGAGIRVGPSRAARRAWPTDTTGLGTVDLLPDLPPLELTALTAPSPLVIAPVVVDPIQIPDITIAPAAGDPGDVKQTPGSSEPSPQSGERGVQPKGEPR